MLGELNYIVKSDDLSKLSKNIKDIHINEKEDECNEKNNEVWVTLNDNWFWREKNFSRQTSTRLWEWKPAKHN